MFSSLGHYYSEGTDSDANHFCHVWIKWIKGIKIKTNQMLTIFKNNLSVFVINFKT